jgi:hypothetical protein
MGFLLLLRYSGASKSPNKALHWAGIPLRSIPASDER